MIEPVHDAPSYRRALARIEQLWDAEPDSPEGFELDALATLVDAYERKQFPIAPPDPIDAIIARCEQLGWSNKNLEPLLGSRARVSEVLNRKRGLTLAMIRKVHEVMAIPASILLQERKRVGLPAKKSHKVRVSPAKKKPSSLPKKKPRYAA